jgi:hypothetical protein
VLSRVTAVRVLPVHEPDRFCGERLRAERYRRHAFDVIVEELDALGLAEHLDELDDGARAEYLTSLADGLGVALQRTVAWWVANELVVEPRRAEEVT